MLGETNAGTNTGTNPGTITGQILEHVNEFIIIKFILQPRETSLFKLNFG